MNQKILLLQQPQMNCDIVSSQGIGLSHLHSFFEA